MAILVIVNSFLVMGVAPWFAFTMIALAVLVVYGVAHAHQDGRRVGSAYGAGTGRLSS